VTIEFDPAKSEKNARLRGLPFHLVEEFDWETAIFWEDVLSGMRRPDLSHWDSSVEGYTSFVSRPLQTPQE
jgi:uncharacterized DUF497 family protein